MKTVIFDTNVLLDIFVFNDFRAIHIKAALEDKQVKALATPKTIEEFADVISRPLFALEKSAQEYILSEWRNLATIIEDETLISAPWKCRDPDDQVFLDLAFTSKPCVLLSKDNELLKLAKKAATESIFISADYSTI
ncbi:putative toxin-antitoxin system toxin component, PIN family [Polynucleobacter sp. MWH-UH2A]|uniref:putative toxin-antitoxin system toxin component, PIN family n=1 Tax=Polynucleobacter sp. MWH-UH2A TaxID=1855617 RepID=UPI001BFDF776|nr:putative toxin-antitoxin system toxin component, PIN family [Polynucleobacter sp. MWH-UH2A]QWD64822.1 putative toxin-antitoxin system toxin component, PIN family [Polynucleobacter sp. MWH-UH2A]